MDKEQQKKALQQKKRDYRNVQKVLRAAHRNDLYGILGMRHWNLKLPATHIQLPFGNLPFPVSLSKKRATRTFANTFASKRDNCIPTRTRMVEPKRRFMHWKWRPLFCPIRINVKSTIKRYNDRDRNALQQTSSWLWLFPEGCGNCPVRRSRRPILCWDHSLPPS
jgi:hypothetical protein